MTTVVSTGRKKAQKLLKEAGDKFITGFMSTHANAITLRSKEPGICWKAGGIVGFAVIGEFSGPNTFEHGSPTLFRLRINFRPPPAVAYHLQSPAVRHKLGLHSSPVVATEPLLELTALPEEIGEFGPWTLDWLDSQLFQRATPPTPPVPLISWGWDEFGNDRRPDFLSLGSKWKDCEYLWTPQAIEVFDPWLKETDEPSYQTAV